MKRAFLLLLCLPSLVAANVLYVNMGEGTYPTIGDALLDAQPGDTVLVGPGTYEEALTLTVPVTLLSAAGAESTVVDAGLTGPVIRMENIPELVRVEAFTLRNGSSPEGGGLSVVSSLVRMQSCVVESCRATGGPLPAGGGGGVHLRGNTQALILDCEIRHNTAHQGGGGLFAGLGANVHLAGCVVRGNEATTDGGGLLVTFAASSVRLDTTTVAFNTASGHGGGLYIWSIREATLRTTIISYNGSDFAPGGAFVGNVENLSVSCCDIFGNANGDWGGSYPPFGSDGNFSMEPFFCSEEVELLSSSPCLPGQHPQGEPCGLIGARRVGCTGLGLLAVTPDTIPYAGPTPLVIETGYMDALPEVALLRAGMDPIPGTNLVMLDPFHLQGEFDVTLLPVGTLDLRAVAGGDTTILEDCVYVRPGTLEGVSPDVIRPGGPDSLTIYGFPLFESSQVVLQREGVADLVPDEVLFVSPTELLAIFAQPVPESHPYGLRVIQLNGDTLTLADSVLVLSTTVTRRVPEDYPTIQSAINHASWYDTISVAPGTYEETLLLTKALVLRSREGWETTRIVGDTWRSVVKIRDTQWPPLIEGFELREGDFDGGAIHCEGSPVVVRNSALVANDGRSAGGAVYLEGDVDGTIIEGNRIRMNRADEGGGIYLDATGRIVIRNNIIASNDAAPWTGRGGGMLIKGAADLVVEGNSFISNDAAYGGGIWAGSFASLVLKRNLFYHNDRHGVYAEAHPDTVSCNIFWENVDGDWQGTPEPLGTDGNAQANPRICPKTLPDPYVHETSPCLPGQHPQGADCGLIGALGMGCSGVVLVALNPGEVDYLDPDTLLVTGYGMSPADTFALVSPQGPPILGQDPVQIHEDSIVVVFDFTAAPPGTLDLVVSSQDAGRDTLADALWILPMELQAVDPDSAAPGDTVVALVRGYPFLPGATAAWVHADLGDSLGILETERLSPDSLRVTVDLAGAAGGRYDVVVRNVNDDVATLARSFYVSGGDTIRVPADYVGLQEAIDAAPDGATILVNPGYFREALTFRGKSLKLVSRDGPEVTTISAEDTTARVVTIQEACGPYVLLQGFAIQYGEGVSEGGGIYMGPPGTIRNCIVQDNVVRGSSSYDTPVGGGIAAPNGGLIEDCIVRNNLAREGHESLGDGWGGGIYCDGGTVRRCTITGNTAVRIGGGVWIEGVLEDCYLSGNKVNYAGSPTAQGYEWYGYGGGGAFLQGGVARRNEFRTNECWFGAELLVGDSTLVQDNLFVGDPDQYGAGILWAGASRFENNTIVNEGAMAFGPVYLDDPPDLTLVENILVSLRLGGYGGYKAGDASPRTFALVDSCNILQDVYLEPDLAGQWCWECNLEADPGFCDADAEDYRVRWDSPALPENNPLGCADTVGAHLGVCFPSGVELPGEGLPGRLRLVLEGPMPARDGVRMRLGIPPGSGDVEVRVFDVAGRRVARLKPGLREAGWHELVWDGRGEAGEPLASGIYWMVPAAGKRTGAPVRVVLIR
jgi:parallel beta-helix repeat protein